MHRIPISLTRGEEREKGRDAPSGKMAPSAHPDAGNGRPRIVSRSYTAIGEEMISR